MKKQLVLLAFLISVVTIEGQTIFLKFGPAFSKITTEATPGASPVTDEKVFIGFDAIAGVNYLNFKYFNLCSGIGFIQGGGEEETATYTSPYQIKKFTVRLNFLTINTTFNLKIPVAEFIEPYIFASPKLDYLFSNSHIGDLFNTNPKINHLIYGALLGGGINFKVKKIQLGLAFDYYINLNKAVDHQEHDEKVSVKTFTVNALIGYIF